METSYGIAACGPSPERLQWAAQMRQKFSPPGQAPLFPVSLASAV